MTRLVIWSNSKMLPSARRLKERLQANGKKVLLTCLRPQTKFKQRKDDTVINWGNSYRNTRIFRTHYNPCNSISRSVNKRYAFDDLSRDPTINIPEYTTDKKLAQQWLEKSTVIGRELLTSFGGRGILLFLKGTELPQDTTTVKLWVKYIPKKLEYRVHVFNDSIIDVQLKRKRNGHAHYNNKIRNLDGGWVYTRKDIVIDEKLLDQAKKAIRALHLNGGAVDIIYNEMQDKYYVLEVNTAPGLSGTTLENWSNAFIQNKMP